MKGAFKLAPKAFNSVGVNFPANVLLFSVFDFLVDESFLFKAHVSAIFIRINRCVRLNCFFNERELRESSSQHWRW